ncbi:carboxymuconolactone decarboxylase family protein [Thalassospira marina]|uniref:Alkylhydroperoxidase n=1 Tax=Thalassospira marina TaxID=2048283 RepID=A0ABN5FEB6_9PROT|nr:carboxymuconolactone decarboxylase family protein [Thalassospira marina]AUG53368.1 alkylhydroperoxidase [Thalassospira marina]
MSRISTPSVDAATGATAELFGQIKKAVGTVPNAYAAIGSLNPGALQSVLGIDAVLAAGNLSKQDQEIIKLLVSSVAGCDYCVAAHSLLGKISGIDQGTLKNIRHGQATHDAKRDALIHFVRTLINSQGTLARADYDTIIAAGYTSAQLVDISLAIAAITFTNVFNRINDTVIDFPAVD